MIRIFFSTSLSFIFKTNVVNKLLVSGIFLSAYSIFSPKFYLSVLYWFMLIYVVAPGISFSKLFTFAFSVLNFVFLTTSLSTA